MNTTLKPGTTSRDNFNAVVAHIAQKTHRKMMLDALSGLHESVVIGPVTITCGDTLQSCTNKLFDGLRRATFDVIDSYI